jgi:DNA-directed RNA polymerase subunit omega
MARISIHDCLKKIPNRFALVVMASQRMRQLLQDQEPMVECDNREAVTALREIASEYVVLDQREKI